MFIERVAQIVAGVQDIPYLVLVSKSRKQAAVEGRLMVCAIVRKLSPRTSREELRVALGFDDISSIDKALQAHEVREHIATLMLRGSAWPVSGYRMR